MLFKINLFAYTLKYLHIHIYYYVFIIHTYNANYLIQLEALVIETLLPYSLITTVHHLFLN